MIKTVDPLGRATTYTYDALRHLASKTMAAGTPDAATWTYNYDQAGNLVSETDPRGAYYTTTYVYNNLGREVEIDEPVGVPGGSGPATASILITYDANGNVLSRSDARDPSYLTTYVYDALNRLIKRTDPAGSMLFTYDADDNLISSTNADGNLTTYSYDLDDRKTDELDADGAHTAFQYDADGNLRFPNRTPDARY